MLDDYSIEIANSINLFNNHIQRLKAWDNVFRSLSDDEKLVACFEFVNDTGNICMGLPYIIRSQLIYATAHLCHQANRLKSGNTWKDEFPEYRNLYLNHIQDIYKGWKKFRRLKIDIEKIGAHKFRDTTGDFRNAYNHRFLPRFAQGITGLVSRQETSSGKIIYAIGGREPLDLGETADTLSSEIEKMHKTFKSFQNIVEKHIAEIVIRNP